MKLHPILVPAASLALFAPGRFDQDAAHGFGGRRKEMPPAVPILLAAAGQAQPSFVDQRGGLERLPGGFVGHSGRREFPEFVVNERKKVLGGFGVALLHAAEDARDVAHRRSVDDTS